MSFKYYIDGQLTDQPVNDTALSTSIVRDDSLKGLIITQDVELVYNGNNGIASGAISGYTYLKALLDDGICNEAAIEIYDELSPSQTILTYKGIIKIPQVKVDEQRTLLSTKIQDNGYYSYINNNKSLKVDFAGIQTKSLNTLTPLQSYTVDLFNSVDCSYGSFLGIEFQGYRLIDAFEFIISAISDNTLGFRSDYLSSLDPEIFIFKGQALINPITLFPTSPDPVIQISFEELFNEIDKLKNLVFFIDQSDVNNPVLRIENSEVSYDGTLIYTFSDLKELTKSVNTKNIYGTVSVGSETTTDGQLPIYTWDSGRSYYGWRKEQFFPLGQCNTNTDLNLISDFVLDSNVIQETGLLQNTSNIDSIFLIECDNVDDVNFTATGYQWEYFGDGGCYYNLGLNNYSKMQRHSSKFETTFGNFLGVGGNGFRALLGASNVDSIVYVTAPGSDPNFIPFGGIDVDPANYVNITTSGGYDGGGNYSVVTQSYTVPTSGNYSFAQFLNSAVAGIVSQEYFDLYVTISLYDAALTLKSENVVQFLLNTNGNQVFTNTYVVDAVATDVVQASYEIIYHPNGVGSQQNPRQFAVGWNSYFECNGTPEGGVSITSGNTSARKYIYDFQYDINATDWQTIEANITQLYAFEKDGVTRYGWIENMKHDNQSGFTQIKIVTNDALITQ